METTKFLRPSCKATAWSMRLKAITPRFVPSQIIPAMNGRAEMRTLHFRSRLALFGVRRECRTHAPPTCRHRRRPSSLRDHRQQRLCDLLRMAPKLLV